MNTPETAAFLDRESQKYVGGLLEMLNARVYRFWASLTEALKTGKPQNEIKHSGAPTVPPRARQSWMSMPNTRYKRWA